MNPIDNDPTQFITIGVEVCFSVSQGFLKALEKGDKMFQKFVETRFLEEPESIYSPITKKTYTQGENN